MSKSKYLLLFSLTDYFSNSESCLELGSAKAESQKKSTLTRQDADLPKITTTSDGDSSSPRLGHRPRPQPNVEQYQEPVDLPPFPSPRQTMRGQTPVELEEPDDLFFIVKELVLTERTYLRDLELAAIKLPAALVQISGRRHCTDATSDSERSDTTTSAGQSVSGVACVCSFASMALHPLLNFHRAFASELESRLCAWTASCSTVGEATLTLERVPSHRQTIILQIGDILMSLTTVLHLYRSYLARLLGLLWSPVVGKDLTLLSEALAANSIDSNLASFYISPALLLCRPAHRLLAYRQLLATYVGHLSPAHPDSLDASALLARLSDLLAGSSSVLGRVDSARILLELRGSIIPQSGSSHDGNDMPFAACSDFVRMGCLHKMTKKGYQPRLFILLSDFLLYAGRSNTSSNQNVFKLHSQISLRDLSLVSSGNEVEPGRLQLVETSTGQRIQLVATSIGDWRRWMSDLRATISMASSGQSNTNSLPRKRYLTPAQQQAQQHFMRFVILFFSILLVNVFLFFNCCSCSVDSAAFLNVSPPFIGSDGSSASPEIGRSNSSKSPHTDQDKSDQTQPAAGACGGASAAHVCWHRALSLGVDDIRLSGTGAQLSSYLLRKFKSAPGWQKLWVVLAADCALHFFKSCYDPVPLASLPLLGYSISSVVNSGGCRSESPSMMSYSQLVFKLQFKSHVYLFRCESRYTYSRWVEAIRCATLAWWTAEQACSDDTADEAADILHHSDEPAVDSLGPYV